MKKHILCFGDSNTHGYCADPGDCADHGGRFNENERWTCLLQKALGEEKMTASLEKFLLLVIRQDRIPYLRYILHYFRMRWCESIGVSPAKLVVSTPSPGLEERIKGIFNDFTGRKLELKTSVDPSIIGGFIFEVADKRIDASISRQLEELRREFIEKNGRVV